MNYKLQLTILVLSLGLVFSSCYKETFIPEGQGLADWTTSTHSSSATPNYNTVFNQTKVNRVDIVISADNWTTMQSDLSDIYGSIGGGPGGGGGFSDQTPVYVPCSWYCNGIEWYHVGIRYKGNSSLKGPYTQGKQKLPFRIKFDEFEDDYVEIKNQTFYGFSELSLSSNYNDKSCMREKTATDLFREFGVPAPQTAYYEVYVDHGSGPVYFGLYTFVEVIFDKMLETQLGTNSGNCYKPDGDGAKWASTGFNLADFEKKTNETSDWSDVQAAYDALHSSTRTTDTTQYKAALEAVFDVDRFLKYLAVNTTIQNWDTYGRMTHNYYLYNDPATNTLGWLPWDNNEAFQYGKMGGSLDFDMNQVNGADWPLIRYLIDIPSYRDKYDAYIRSFIDTAFEPTKMQAQYNAQKALIESSVTSELSTHSFLNSPSDFNSAVTELINHASTQNSAADAYLN